MLINGDMVEATEKCAVLEDVDEDVFVRFCEFAYRGDYDIVDGDKSGKSKRKGEIKFIFCLL